MGTARAINPKIDASPDKPGVTNSAIELLVRTEDQVRFGRPIRLGLLCGALLTIAGMSHAAQPALRTNLQITTVTPKPFLEQIRDRPAPDLSRLLARCRSSSTNWDSFLLLDLLKLRESPDPAAVPTLANMLAEFRDTGYTYKEAAAQALYAIGTPEAHAALSEILITKFTIPKYPAQAHPYFTQAGQFHFASYWQMQEPLRSGFVARYVLTNLSTDLVVDVSYRRLAEGQIRGLEYQGTNNIINLEFQLGFSNTTQNPLVLRNFDPSLLRTMLYLRRSDGTYPDRYRTGPGPLQSYARGSATLLPRTRKTYVVQGVLRPASPSVERTNWPPFVLQFMNYCHYLTPGDYSVIAMCEAFPLTPRPETRPSAPAGQRKSGDEKAGEVGWWGRAVSKPVSLIVPSSKQANGNEQAKRPEVSREATGTNRTSGVTDSLSVTNVGRSSASSLVRQIAYDIEALKSRFSELSEFSASNHLAPAKISYRHNIDYVEGSPKGHYSVKQGGCLISIEAWDTKEGGWPGMAGGQDTLSIDRTLPNGIHVMANIRAPNEKLRRAVADRIASGIHTIK